LHWRPLAGRLIDRRGGRDVLVGSNLILAAGLLALAAAQGPVMLFVAWQVIGFWVRYFQQIQHC
jgi:MFS family permease